MKNIIYTFTTLILISCSSNKKFFDENYYAKYEDVEGYKYLYIVDTINIQSSVIVTTVLNNSFVMSAETFRLYDKKLDFFLTHKDIYIYADELPLSIIMKAEYRKYLELPSCDNSKYIKQNKDIKNIKEYWSYQPNPDYYLLVLMRGDFYNYCYSYLVIDGPPPIKFKSQYNYYKVAIPFCKGREPKQNLAPKYDHGMSVDSLRAN